MMSLYHLIRWSVAPEHVTTWVAIQSLATIGGSVAVAIYVFYTYRLWQETSRTNQSALMQQLMVEYDSRREDVAVVREFYTRYESAEQAIGAFQVAVHYGAIKDLIKQVDDSRFRLSRFFVKTRKLSKAGFLDRRLIAIALQRKAIETVFLACVDPLDQAHTLKADGKPNTVDRKFYTELLRDLPELLSNP